MMKLFRPKSLPFIASALGFKNISSFATVQGKLFTPGPLLTSKAVKSAMNFDYGSRDPDFLKYIKEIRDELLNIAQVSQDDYTTIIMQGSGTFGVESTITTAIPKENHHLLVCANGAYGERIAKIAGIHNISHSVLRYKDNQIVRVEDVVKALRSSDIKFTHLACIHSETTSGIINNIEEIGLAAKSENPELVYIVDAMSSFGGYDINLRRAKIDYLVSSSNKCLHGVPGFCFILANKSHFLTTSKNARTLSMDLFGQWKGLEENGQFRFTPPTHAIKAFWVAMKEFKEEGSFLARGKKFESNQRYMADKMKEMGFKLYIDEENQGRIITTFLQPNHPNWDFQEFYNFLSSKNLIIYPGKLTEASSFRIGSIGELKKSDFKKLTDAVREYLGKKQIPIPVKY